MGISESEVEDVAQDFFIGFFESQSLDRADSEHGRFRAYLVGALRHHVQKLRRKASAQKRGGGNVALPLDALEQSAPHEADHARLFDLEWAQTMMAHSMARLESETSEQGMDAAQTSALIHGDATIPQREIAARLGISVTAMKTRVFRLRRRFREILREEVSRTVANAVELEGEMAYLSEILGGPVA